MKRFVLPILLAASLTALAHSPASATHAWENYHWAASPGFALVLADSTGETWDAYVDEASADWTRSRVVSTSKVETTNQLCQPVAGRVEVCSGVYADNWLGLASIWLSNGHISQGTVKVNDRYFASGSRYDVPAWRRMVMCQEIGHTFGLGHVNENFNDANTGSCMDYTNDPSRNDGNGTNEHPNQHDYDLLQSIYDAHAAEGTTTAPKTRGGGGKGGGGKNRQDDWGRAINMGGPHGHGDVFEKDLGNGTKVITHVFWADHDHAHEH